MVLERSGYLTHVPGLRLAPVQLKLDLKKALALDRWAQMQICTFKPIILCTGCHLDTTHTWVRCLVLVNQTGEGVLTKAMARGATTVSIAETR